jgi:alkanesulfonate monooxygenase SsuD/methylene tetrahydromethanopterin reductase-like flavin-dependent oxidoreductase (luciferase family)
MSQDNRKILFGLWYDFRNPSQWRQSPDQLYRETLDQIAWSENHGFDDVWLSEHHFIEDGYLPSILPVAAAIAARTKRIRISSGVLLMPFHNPVRLAEDIAVVDVISGGRLELGVGVGFKHEEFESFGVPFKERGARTNQSLDIIRRLLSGETVTFKSEFFDFKNVKVTPEPVQKPHPPVWLGGFHPGCPAARRSLWRWIHGARCDPRRIRPVCRRVEEAESAHRQHPIRQRGLVHDRIQRPGENVRRGRRPRHLSSQQLLEVAICGGPQSPFRPSGRSRTTAQKRAASGG